MIVHVGLYPVLGKLAAIYIYDNQKKVENVYSLSPVFMIEHVDVMFEQLKSTLSAPLGCICICLPPRLENYKEKFITVALKSGFQKVEVIKEDTADCVQRIYKSNLKFKRNSIIWICTNIYDVHIWENGGYQETIKNVLGKEGYEKLLKMKHPNVILCDKQNSDFFDDFVKNFVPACKLILVRPNFYMLEESALTYAKLMAGEINLYSDDSGSDSLILDKSHQTETNSDMFSSKSSTPSTSEKQIPIAKPNLLSRILPNVRNTNAGATKKEKIQILKNQHYFVFPNKMALKFAAAADTMGIDLGTSKCCAAVNRRNGIEAVALDYKGERLLPSFVSFDEKKPICGNLVIDRLRNFSNFTVFDSKRIIGRKMGDIVLEEIWPFGIIEKDGKIFMSVKKVNGKGCVSAEEVAAILLKKVKEESEKFQGKKLADVVITVPAAFTKAQKDATIEAAKLAGFKEVKLLPEPIAAAFAYFINRPIPNNSTVLLFDLGGGTLDVCIFKIINDQICIISNTGDSKLGGRDFDTILINHFKNQLSTKYNITLLSKRNYQMMTTCQKIKETLSVMDKSFLDIDEFDVTQNGIISVTRAEFENMTTVLLNRIKNTLLSALHDSKNKENQIDKVLQVGGGSRMPMIKNLLKEIFPNAEHCCEEHPEEVVAIGAAYYAYSIFANTAS